MKLIYTKKSGCFFGGVLVVLMGGLWAHLVQTTRATPPLPRPALTPWRSIGGCGAGGSGGGSSAIRWMGEGVSGSRVVLEFLPKGNFSRTFGFITAAPRLSLKPYKSFEAGLSLPIGFKAAESQFQSNLMPQTWLNGGRGDLSLDIGSALGGHSQFAWQWTLVFPTGQYDGERGPDRAKNILPQNLQMGRGIYETTLSLSYTHDLEAGFLLFKGDFAYPFMLRFDKENPYLDSDYQAYRNVTQHRERFYYPAIVKLYGESDRGDFYPPAISFDAVIAGRRPAGLVQSLQLLFSFPLGVRWIHSHVPTLYDPRPDPDNRAWDLVLSYGLEISRDRLPIFLGIGMPIHDKLGQAGENDYDESDFGRWSQPDWAQIGQEWIFAVGIKAAIF